MELKQPRPLGEKNLSNTSVTDQFLEISKNKHIHKKKLPKVSIPSFDFFKPKDIKTEEKQNTIDIQTPHLHNNRITENLKLTLSVENIKIYIQTHKEKFINISLVLVPLLILLILAIVILSYTRSEPYRVAKEFLQKVEQKDTQGAYELTTDAYRAVVTEKEFKKVMDRMSTVDISNAKIKKKSIDNEKEMGEYANIRYKVSGYYLDIVMYNDYDDWGIHSIQMTVIQ